MARLSRDQVLHVANLARLALEESEVEAMTRQLDTILEYARSLEGLDTQGVEPTSHPLPMSTAWREDRSDAPLPAAQAVANAPDHHETAFVVPKILDTDEV